MKTFYAVYATSSSALVTLSSASDIRGAVVSFVRPDDWTAGLVLDEAGEIIDFQTFHPAAATVDPGFSFYGDKPTLAEAEEMLDRTLSHLRATLEDMRRGA